MEDLTFELDHTENQLNTRQKQRIKFISDNRTFYIAWYKYLKLQTSDGRSKCTGYYLRELIDGDFFYSVEGAACNAWMDIHSNECWEGFVDKKGRSLFKFDSFSIEPPNKVEDYIKSITLFDYDQQFWEEFKLKYDVKVSIGWIEPLRRHIAYRELIIYCIRASFKYNKTGLITKTDLIPWTPPPTVKQDISLIFQEV